MTGSLPWASVLILLIRGFNVSEAEREHKVHNIVLYPDKYSWCQTTPIQQVVGSQGFKSITIHNNICVGACYSYSIPKTHPAEPGEVLEPYCDSCQPSEIKWYHMSLESEENSTYLIQKHVQIIVNCSCLSCDKTPSLETATAHENTDQLPFNLYNNENSPNKSAEEIPELLDVPAVPAENPKDNETVAMFKTKAKIWFSQNVHNGETNSDEDFDNSNLNKLFDLDDENSAKIEDDLNDLPLNNAIEGRPSSLKPPLNPKDLQHLLKKAQESLGLKPITINPETKPEEKHIRTSYLSSKPSESPDLIPIEKLTIDSNAKPVEEGVVISYENHHQHNADVSKPTETKHHHQHHHLGELQYQGGHVEHLVKGPHGSMVLEPVAKLDIDASAPSNEEGLILSYENHHNRRGQVIQQ